MKMEYYNVMKTRKRKAVIYMEKKTGVGIGAAVLAAGVGAAAVAVKNHKKAEKTAAEKEINTAKQEYRDRKSVV